MDDATGGARGLIAAILLNVAAQNFYFIAPIFLGAAADDLSLSADQLGFLIGAELFAMAPAGLLAPLWIVRLNWRLCAVFSVAIMAIGGLLSMVAENYETLMAIRAATGLLGEGPAFAVSVAALGEARNPDRVFGWTMVISVGMMALLLYGVPPFIGDWGLVAPMAALALVSLAMLPMQMWMPTHSQKRELAMTAELRTSPYLAYVGVAAFTLWYLALGAFWTFVERLGDAAGLSTEYIGFVLGTAAVLSVVGALAAVVMGERYGRLWPVILSIVVATAAFASLTGNFTAALYMASITLLYIGWTFGTPYMLGLIATADTGAQGIAMMPIAYAFGVAGGSVLAGVMSAKYGYVAANGVAIAGCVVCLAIFIPFGIKVTRGTKQ